MGRKERKQPVWITTGGDPAILMPRVALMAWSGAELPRDVRGGHEARSGAAAGVSQHDRARSIDGPAGVIEVHGRDALVIGGAPRAVTWLPAPDGGLVICGDAGERGRLPPASVLERVAWQPVEPALTSREATWTLFDAACPGWEIDLSCAVHLAPGRYALAQGTHGGRAPLRLIRVSRLSA